LAYQKLANSLPSKKDSREQAMPGAGRIQFEPTKPLPWLAVVLIIATFTDFVVDWLLMFTINRWAHQFPTPGHWYEFRMKFGRTYYLSPFIGWYLDNNLWIYFGGFALFFLIAFLYGVRWKRVR
jgi:hypothetical protein